MSEKDYTEIIKAIKRECFWDYNISEDEILHIAVSGSDIAKKKLFAKIIYNSSDKIKSLEIFSRDDLRRLFDSFSPSGHKKFIVKNFYILGNILLGNNNRIKELEWKKR